MLIPACANIIKAFQNGLGNIGHGLWFGPANTWTCRMRAGWRPDSNDKRVEWVFTVLPDCLTWRSQTHNPALRDRWFKSSPRNQFSASVEPGRLLAARKIYQ